MSTKPLREYDDRFEAIVAIAADAIISVDEQHLITLFNQGAEEIFGYSAAEIVGKPLNLLIPERFRPQHGSHIGNFAHSPTAARRMGERREIFGLRRDGAEFPAEASISKIDVDGKRVFTVVLRDVSDRKRLEDERARLLTLETEARVAAEQAARLRDEVLGVVSHDLRNPLSVITMCTSVLASGGNTEAEVLELAGTIRAASTWMQRLIKDLLDVASIESGKLALERRKTDAMILIVKSAQLFDQLAREKSVVIDLDVPDNLPAVFADSDRVTQVLSNILGNAIKFSSEGTSVTMRAHATHDELHVSVSDTGPGISTEDLPRIFDRFWHARRGGSVRGTGLGLAIAKGLIVAHGGNIWAESVEGSGSTFRFTLPLQELPPAAVE